MTDHIHKNNKGASLLMVMLIGVGLVGLSLVVMQADKISKKNSLTVNADRDIEEAMGTLISIFSNPTSCNLALRGKPYSSTLTALGSLKKAATDPKFTVKFDDYDMFDSGITATSSKKNTKIRTLSYRMAVPQSTGSTGPRPRVAVAANPPDSPNAYPALPGYQPAIFNIVIKFTKRLVGNGSTPGIESPVPKVYIIEVPVVTSTFNFVEPTSITDSPTVIGCAKSASSTLAYP